MPAQLRVISALALTLSVSAAAAAQVPPPRDPVAGQTADQAVGTAVVSGTVTMAGTGQPARKVRVNLSSPEIRGSRTVTTDDQGRFSFTALPAGRYNLSASRPGHMTVAFGQRQPGRPGTPIQLSDGQKFQAQLQIPKSSVLTGTVFDENGEPAPMVSVRAMRIQIQNGERTSLNSNAVTTDDRGIYRIFGLQPGDYIVCATPRNQTTTDVERVRIELQSMQQALQQAAQTSEEAARGLRDRIASLQATVANTPEETPPGYASVCYPGTVSLATAGTIPLGISEERAAVDFQLQLAPMARVEGTVVNPTGSQLRDIQLRLSDLSQLSETLGSMTARADGQGNFRFGSVPPGQYRLTARAMLTPPRPPGPPPPGPPGGGGGRGRGEAVRAEPVTLWASADIVVDGRNVSNVMLSLQQGITVSGQLRFDGSTQPPADLTRVRVAMSPFGGNPLGGTANGRVDASGRFTIPGVVPGRYRMTASGAPGWFVESAVTGGQDALDIPIEIKGNQNLPSVTITLTDRQTELTGTVVDTQNQPATDYTLVVFPADSRFWMRNARRIQTARPATDGRFTFRNLPAGDYLLAPAVDLEVGSHYDAAFLQQLEPSAVRITLQPGEKKVQDLRVGR